MEKTEQIRNKYVFYTQCIVCWLENITKNYLRATMAEGICGKAALQYIPIFLLFVFSNWCENIFDIYNHILTEIIPILIYIWLVGVCAVRCDCRYMKRKNNKPDYICVCMETSNRKPKQHCYTFIYHTRDMWKNYFYKVFVLFLVLFDSPSVGWYSLSYFLVFGIPCTHTSCCCFQCHNFWYIY